MTLIPLNSSDIINSIRESFGIRMARLIRKQCSFPTEHQVNTDSNEYPVNLDTFAGFMRSGIGKNVPSVSLIDKAPRRYHSYLRTYKEQKKERPTQRPFSYLYPCGISQAYFQMRWKPMNDRIAASTSWKIAMMNCLMYCR